MWSNRTSRHLQAQTTGYEPLSFAHSKPCEPPHQPVQQHDRAASTNSMGVSQTDTKVKHRCWTYTVTDAQTYAGIVLDIWHGTEASIGVEGSKLCHVHQCVGGYADGRSEAHAKCVCHAASLALGHAHTRSSGHELTSTGLAQRNDAAATNGAAAKDARYTSDDGKQ